MPETWSLLKVLNWTSDHFKKQGISSYKIDAELILSHVLEIPRIQIYVQFEKVLTKNELEKIKELIKRRSTHEPIAYILGYKDFHTERFLVDKCVLIPRPETEFIIDEVEKIYKTNPENMEVAKIKVLDMGTGSGNIAIMIKKLFPDMDVSASDISEEALIVAKKNAVTILKDKMINFIQSDMFASIPDKFDLIVSNPPYIPETVKESLDKDVKDFEPSVALFAGQNGMDFYNRFFDEVKDHLNEGGCIILEAGIETMPLVKKKAEEKGFTCHIVKDYSGIERVVVGRLDTIAR